MKNLEEILTELLKSKYNFTDPRVKATKISFTIQEILKCVPKEKQLYGGTCERATNLPPDIECSNTGFNQCRTELLKNLGVKENG
jgi:hypothetical protein